MNVVVAFVFLIHIESVFSNPSDKGQANGGQAGAPGGTSNNLKKAHPGKGEPITQQGTPQVKLLEKISDKLAENEEDDLAFQIEKLAKVQVFDRPKKTKLVSFNIERLNFSDYDIRRSINPPLSYRLTPAVGLEIKSIVLRDVVAWKREENSSCKEVTLYFPSLTFLMFKFDKNGQSLYRFVVRSKNGYHFLSVFEFVMFVNQPFNPVGATVLGSITEDRSASQAGLVGNPTNTTSFTNTLDLDSAFDRKYFDFRSAQLERLEVRQYLPSGSPIYTVVDKDQTVFNFPPKTPIIGSIRPNGVVPPDASATTQTENVEGVVEVKEYLRYLTPLLLEVIIAQPKAPESDPKDPVIKTSKYFGMDANKWTEIDRQAFLETLNKHFKPVLDEPLEKFRPEKQPTKINLQNNDYKIHFSLSFEDFKYVKTAPIQRVESILDGTDLIYQEVVRDCQIGLVKSPKIELMEVESAGSSVYFIKTGSDPDGKPVEWAETSQIRFIQVMDRIVAGKNSKYITITGRQERELVDKIPELKVKKDEEGGFFTLTPIISVILITGLTLL